MGVRRRSSQRRHQRLRNGAAADLDNAGDGRPPAFRASAAGGVVGERATTGSLLRRVLLKLCSYGAMLLVVRWYKGERPSKQPQDEISPSSVKRYRTFLSGPGVEVHVVENFFPPDLAARWRETLSYEWRRDSGGAWKYATNNNGLPAGGPMMMQNQKVRSLDGTAARNSTAHRMYERGEFSYSKFELDPSHPLVSEIKATMVEMREQVADLISGNGDVVKFMPKLSDLFVTHYSTGDFLSPHDDGFSGTLAFVVSLIEGKEGKGWDDEYGGGLRFECAYRHGESPRAADGGIRWCESLLPSFNTAIFFRTRPRGPMHEVLPVSWRASEEGYRRFGLTGWYMRSNDVMDEHSRRELEKMTGRGQ